MSATVPVSEPAGNAAHASLVVVDVPVRAMGNVPVVGGAGAPAAAMYPMAIESGEIVNAVRLACVLSTDATPMTSRPTPGVPEEYKPVSPAFPIDATTTTPRRTRRLEARARGSCGQKYVDPRLMFTTSVPSSYALSSASRMMSVG